MGELLTVRIPGAPDLALSPNRRYRDSGSWAGAAAARAARRVAAYHGRAQWLGGGRPGEAVVFDGPVRLRATIAWPKGQRRLDFDSAVGVLKAYLDGLTDAGWWQDDRQIAGMDVAQVRADKGDRAGWVEIAVLAVEK